MHVDLVSENSAEYIDSLVPSSVLWDGHVPGDGRQQAGLVGVLSLISICKSLLARRFNCA